MDGAPRSPYALPMTTDPPGPGLLRALLRARRCAAPRDPAHGWGPARLAGLVLVGTLAGSVGACSPSTPHVFTEVGGAIHGYDVWPGVTRNSGNSWLINDSEVAATVTAVRLEGNAGFAEAGDPVLVPEVADPGGGSTSFTVGGLMPPASEDAHDTMLWGLRRAAVGTTIEPGESFQLLVPLTQTAGSGHLETVVVEFTIPGRLGTWEWRGSTTACYGPDEDCPFLTE